MTTPDGRTLTVEVSGDSAGTTVFLLHGTPGSRNGPKPRGSVLYRLGVKLVTYDRPGYGGSTRQFNRTVADAAADIGAVADALGFDRFAVVGRSGGGPHALACAALLPDRLIRTAVLVGIAPSDATGLDWFDGMADDNVREYSTADNDFDILIERLRVRAERTVSDPESLIELLRTQMAEPDRYVTDSLALRRMLAETYTEALRHGPGGWIDDVLAFRKDWGFDLATISSPVRLWHGADDTFSPASHARWLASRIPGAEVQVQRNAAHFGAISVLPEILAWLTASQPDQLQPSSAG
ncbi:pimeloyl-ACP methyl ester carboxylesterase [Allocatelliglobosispora scoriae]|uniref:Pimeloyl-ACP methyl ester carboxylesterase n=1 Tax=Allocatelliglobosispora scoriae TaxID=643052 RepID=A0A841BQJ9_9ACTN|nr:alpha/beta hydrolase [Allocatelliglobosispora scoriae]MBB5869101.1 pimeloyl-ACP methyl ester carboxylesterase [Allocatelliglobosispora scoriae]